MAQIAGTNVIAPVVPGDTVDVFPSHLALYGHGGYRTVADIPARDAIPPERREQLMAVAVIADGNIYRLVGGIGNEHWALDEILSTVADLLERVILLEDAVFGIVYLVDGVGNSLVDGAGNRLRV